MVAGDGQVTVGNAVVVKPNAIKVRRLGPDVVAGFAGRMIRTMRATVIMVVQALPLTQ